HRLWRDPSDEHPRQVVAFVVAEALGLLMRGAKCSVAVARAGIVRRARGRPGEDGADRLEQGVALFPPRMRGDDAPGVAVQAGGVSEHADQMLGLILDVARAPVSWDDNDRADVAQLAGDALVEQRLASSFARGSFGSRTPYDGVEGLVGAGNVDL